MKTKRIIKLMMARVMPKHVFKKLSREFKIFVNTNNNDNDNDSGNHNDNENSNDTNKANANDNDR